MNIEKDSVYRLTTTNSRLILISAAILTLFYNYAFFRNVLAVYPFTVQNLVNLATVAILLYCSITLVLTLFCYNRLSKIILGIVFLVSSIVAYAQDTFNIVVDRIMLMNLLQTNAAELRDLMSLKLFVYFLVLGIVPTGILYFVTVKRGSFKKELLSACKLFGLFLFVSMVIVLSFSRYYASFFREHKSLRYYANPTMYIYSMIDSIYLKIFEDKDYKIIPIVEKADIPETDKERELTIFVVGETARADRFSLNGYQRNTNPLLSREDIINFPELYSSGTSTAISVPLMFSPFDDLNQAIRSENILDVLKKAGVHILWRDNNSSSKGVAERVKYQDFTSPETNPICDIECRDEGMLVGLDDYIASKKSGDILIILHQMGSHGPAYYKRYPERFKKFTPVCETNQLEKCSSEEINNAYDNTILYTDYFLHKVIQFLKKYSDTFETAMIYMSDHGESLGEHGIYLHGLPYLFAPKEQKHIPGIIWIGERFRQEHNIDMKKLRQKARQRFTHDIIFHTLLGIMEIETPIYDPTQDFFNDRS